MTIVSGLIKFFHMALDLPSLYLFFGYMGMIFLSNQWQNRTKPMGLRPLLILHNFGCCLLSVFTLAAFSFSLYKNGSIYGKTPDSLLVFTFRLYWITKVIELLDTVFMILRHKQRQISFLHVYHHSSMLLLSDMSRLFYPWPSIAFFLGMNSFVHVILYLYYGLTALRPNNPPQWKKQMTQIQILQFIIGFFIASYGYLKHNFCIYGIFYGLTMTFLFSNFYYHAYVRKRPAKPDSKLS